MSHRFRRDPSAGRSPGRAAKVSPAAGVGNGAAEFMTRNKSRGSAHVQPRFPVMNVGAADPAGTHLDDDIMAVRFRGRNIHQSKMPGAGYFDCLHIFLLFLLIYQLFFEIVVFHVDGKTIAGKQADGQAFDFGQFIAEEKAAGVDFAVIEILIGFI